MRYSVGPEDQVPRLSHDAPGTGNRPVDDVGTSAMGSKAICAPSNEQPPAVAPGLGRRNRIFPQWLWLQAGSLSKAWNIACFHCASPLEFTLGHRNSHATFNHLIFIKCCLVSFVAKLTKSVTAKPKNRAQASGSCKPQRPGVVIAGRCDERIGATERRAPANADLASRTKPSAALHGQAHDRRQCQQCGKVGQARQEGLVSDAYRPRPMQPIAHHRQIPPSGRYSNRLARLR